MEAKNTGARSSKTVTVACKYPGGLILRLQEMHEFEEPVMGGGMRTVRRSVEVGDRVIIQGPAAEPGKRPFMRNAMGMTMSDQFVDADRGFALTPGVDADFWERWLAQNASMALVKNGLIFANKQASSVRSQIRDHEGIRSGLEGIDPDRPDPRHGNIQPTDEQQKRMLGDRLKQPA